MPQSAVHGAIRPLLTQFQWDKRGQGGSLSAPKPQVGPPEPVFGPKTQSTQNGQNHLRTHIGQEPQNGHKSVHGLWKLPEATKSAQSKDSPPVEGKNSLSSMHSVLKDQEWCIYGIIYHYARFCSEIQ
ncbi:hypothetical protein O181_020509 [Austropuccinia psidii MF-1]|uniref:Uncharacterized protein n=1 Tax=Austropuccinia psidii MF-1 TaxID=1389203 RepID=A0A9Q3C925_9BASI|nr:hypothetical protein [Austropuccinia psidii MF-1]